MSALAILMATFFLVGCGPAAYRRQADKAAYDIIRNQQQAALKKEEAFSIEPPSETLRRRLLLTQELPHSGAASLGADHLEPIAHWPEKLAAIDPVETDEDNTPAEEADSALLKLSLEDALQIAARNSRDYQTQKEDVFFTALDLDLERNDFRYLFAGTGTSAYTNDPDAGPDVQSLLSTGTGQLSKTFHTGAQIASQLVLDLAKLLTQDDASAFGILADATIMIPLLRGAGKHIVTEPLTQAQRDVVYSLYTLERFKRTLAVRVASDYLAVLRQLDQIQNEENNYRQLIAGTRRARRLADENRLPEIQVDQAKQDELRARNRWIIAQQTYAQRLDQFKITLGLPTDANIKLDRAELQRLAEGAKQHMAKTLDGSREPKTAPVPRAADSPIDLKPPTHEDGGPLEMQSVDAIAVALENRLDLRTLLGGVYDAQRRVVVAADALKAGLKIIGTAEAGERRSSASSASSSSVRFRPEHGFYSVALELDLPLERTTERNAYRESFIALEQAVRNAQQREDQIKLDVREALRNLLQARESLTIQAEAVKLDQRRVASTEMFLEVGRSDTQVRDVLEAQESLVSAQNALTAALVNYRVTELELQRDMGVLEINEKGLWREYQPSQVPGD